MGSDPLLGVVTESLLALDENNVMDKITLTPGILGNTLIARKFITSGTNIRIEDVYQTKFKYI